MLKRRSRSLEVLSISALDLFASALGVFILMAILLFPYYLKQPSLEADQAAAEHQLERAGADLSDARKKASEASRERAAAEARRNRAVNDLQQAEAAHAEAEQALFKAQAKAREVGEKRASVMKDLATLPVTDLDLVFVMDTTRSMRDEIEDVRGSLQGLIRVLYKLAPSLNLGMVVYRDEGEQYVTRSFKLRPMTGQNLTEVQSFVDGLRPDGGGDIPEAVEQGLEQAVNMRWRTKAQGLIIVIGDAPAHKSDEDRAFSLARAFVQSSPGNGVRRRVATIYTGPRNKAGHIRFFSTLSKNGDGDFVRHRGRIVESVLLSVMETPGMDNVQWDPK